MATGCTQKDLLLFCRVRNVRIQKRLSKKLSLNFCGMDETRTRDLLRDRQAF